MGKSALKEHLGKLGHDPVVMEASPDDTGPAWRVTVRVCLDAWHGLEGLGVHRHKARAEDDACAALLERVRAERPHLCVDWPRVRVEAQAGDALLKLAAYLAADLDTAADRSFWLQRYERNVALADAYETLEAERAPELVPFGPRLGAKARATLVEAVLWRRFGARVLSADAPAVLHDMRCIVDPQTGAPAAG